MPDSSRSRIVALACRCGSTVSHEHWDVIDAMHRPDLARALANGDLSRVRCDVCGRLIFVDEAVAVLRKDADTPLIMLFADREPATDAVSHINDLPVMWAPASAAPYLLERDLDADAEQPDAARLDVERRFGPVAGFMFSEALRHYVVVTDSFGLPELVLIVVGTDLAGFQSLLDQHPDLTSEAFERSTERFASVFPEQAVFARAVGRLMTDASVEPQAAWESFQAALTRFSDKVAQLVREYEALEATYQAGNQDEVVGQGRLLIEHCRNEGAFLLEGVVSEFVAQALLQQPSYDRAKDIEEVIRLLHSAVDRSGDNSVMRAGRLSHLAVAYEQRLKGDRRDNIETAIALFREGVRVLGVSNPDMLAWLQTNLAFALTLREVEDPIDDLLEARDLCQRALNWRTPTRNVNDWAYTQVNLAAILARLADHGQARRGEARVAYAAVLRYASQVEQQVVATALTNVARLDRDEPGRVLTGRQHERRLRASRKRLADQLDTLDDLGPIPRGRALHELAQTELDLNDRTAAIAHLAEATSLLRPEVSPSDCERVAAALASLLADGGQWERAAAAFADAVAASDLRFYERGTAASRESEARARGNLSRWASYAAARAGDARQAVLLLEDGRTRELRLRMGAGDETRAALLAAAPELHAAYDRALADLMNAQLADDAEAAATRFRDTLEQVRAVRGLEHFGGPVSFDVVVAATTDGQPLVYVNPTPWGTAVLTVMPDGTVTTRLVAMTSTTLAHRLILGLDEHGQQTAPSFLAAASHDGTGIERALASTLRWMGEALADPVGAELRATGASAGTLVLCGLLGQFPIHVAPRPSAQSGNQALVDEFNINFSPSAAMHSAAHRRARERGASGDPPVLVALGDPTHLQDPLPASRAEVAIISTWFRPDQRHVAVESEATSDFLRQYASTATYLHFAGHALGSAFDFRKSHLKLADGDLPLTELSRIGLPASRLAVASACQTALPDTDLSDEAYSVAAILLAAGATSAIASLWPVDDVATSLLMMRFYQELLGEDHPPSRALRHAQIWLRDLDRDNAKAIIEENELLAAEAARRAKVGDNILPPGNHPFADPGYWAAFISMGV